MMKFSLSFSVQLGLLYLALGQALSQAASTEDSGSRRELKVYNASLNPRWFDNDTKFWYRREVVGGGHRFILVDTVSGDRKEAFDHERVAEKLGGQLKKAVEADNLPIDSIEFVSESVVHLTSGESQWNLNLDTYEIVQEDQQEDRSLDDSLPVFESIFPSGQSRIESEIEFVNRLQQPVDLIWVDAAGEQRKYEQLGAGKTHKQHSYAGHVWLVADTAGKQIAVFRAKAQPARAIIDGRQPTIRNKGARQRTRRRRQDDWQRNVGSPDGRWKVLCQNHNLMLLNLESNEEFMLTTDGTSDNTWHKDVSRRRAIGMNYRLRDAPPEAVEVYWSPNSRFFMAIQTKTAPEPSVHLVESAPKDQVQPRQHSYPYFKPGDQIPIQQPALFEVQERKRLPLNKSLFENPFVISDIRWKSDSSRCTFVYNQRGHQVLRIIAIDPESGNTSAIVNEEAKTFIDYAGKSFYRILDATDEIIWMSERDGWNHLYLYDGINGTVKNQITKGHWTIRRVERVDQENRQIWFYAGGIHAGQDPYHLHFCRVDFDGSNLVVLTRGDGTHEITLAPNRNVFIAKYSRVDLPPRHELRRTKDGQLVCELEQADASELLQEGWRFPERFAAKARDGKTDIFGIIHRPRQFDATRSYPVIEAIYAGPHGAHVPKRFRQRYRTQQRLADLGFIVVQIDGLGTSYRSKAFHDVCWKNIADAGFPDRIAWIKAAAEKYPFLDISRVGIFGGSAGGQNSLGALLFHGDFYKVAVSDCGCHDNRMDKIWWNELWMGWPVESHYDEQSNVTNAHRLNGKLLLIVGELDRNVDPASTMQVVNALIKADKDFELLVVPGGGHGIAESPYGSRRRADFFVKHLLRNQ